MVCSSFAAAPAPAPRPRRSRADQLERVAQPFGRDPHVVLRHGRARLAAPARTGLRSSSSRAARSRAAFGRSGLLRLQALDLRRLHALTAPTRSSSADRRARRRSSPTNGARAVFASRCSSRSLAMRISSRPRVAGRSPLDETEQELDRDVAVAALAERVGELRQGPHRRLQPLLREAGSEDLERGPQAPGRDPHVVQRLDVLGAEDPGRVLEDLGRAHLDHPCGGELEAARRSRAPVLRADGPRAEATS